MPAKYRLVAKLGDSSSIVILRIYTEHELALDVSRFSQLSNIVHNVGDGEFNEDELFEWNIVLGDIDKLHREIAEVPHYVIGRETPWRQLPSKALYKILMAYQGAGTPTFMVGIDGRPPSLSIVFNVGIASVKFPMDEAGANQFVNEVALLSAECDKADQEGRDWKEAGDAVVDVGKVTASTTKCAWEIAKMAADRGKSAGKAFLACTAAASSISDMMKAIREKNERERERMEREKLDHIEDCKPDRSIDPDRLDKYTRSS